MEGEEARDEGVMEGGMHIPDLYNGSNVETSSFSS
jgi:hypothetical protein